MLQSEKRVHYRRYEDRRIAMMLAVYEILFDYPPGRERDRRLLEALARNYHVEGAQLVTVAEVDGRILGTVDVAVGALSETDGSGVVDGEGFVRLAALHESADGALTFESVRKPEVFADFAWQNLWQTTPPQTRALLSMQVDAEPRTLIWLTQIGSTREWSSRDRDLVEEVADLMARARRKGV